MQYLNLLIEKASVLCAGKPPVSCQCDNDPTVTMEPPFDFFKVRKIKSPRIFFF